MAADFDKPTVSDVYTDVLPQLRDNIDLTATMFASGAGSNTPVNSVQFLGGNFSVWNGATFVITPIAISGGGTGGATAAVARTNLDVYSKSEASAEFLDATSNLSDVANPATSYNNIKQAATTTSIGAVEQATSSEMTTGTASKFPDCSTVKSFTDATYLNESNNLSDVVSALTSFNNIKQSATTSFAGVVEEATTTEMASGTNGKFPDAATIQTVLSSAVKSTNGYWKDKNTGVIIQWGFVNPSANNFTVVYPISFPTAALNASMTTQRANGNDGRTLQVITLGSSSMNCFAFNHVDDNAYWIAIGY